MLLCFEPAGLGQSRGKFRVLQDEFELGGGHLRVLADNLSAALAPIRARAEALSADEHAVRAVLAAGAARARAEARRTLDEVKSRMGVLPALQPARA